MRVALVNPPFSKLIYGSEHPIKGVTPALGLFYLQAICPPGIEAEVFEGELYDDFESLIAAVNSYRPDICGITTNTSTYPLCVRAANAISARIKIAGGPYATFRISECLETFDAVFVGDAEVSFEAFLRGLPLAQIQGVAFKNANGDVMYNGEPVLAELDTIPFPDHARLQKGHYRASPHRELDEPFATMMTTRGCGFQCTFCLSARAGMNDGRYRERSVENVITEVRLLTTKYGVKSIQFWDDTFTMRKERTRELCHALVPMGISYVCNTRTDKVDQETADLLAASGCKSVFFGVESGVEALLQGPLGKYVRNEQVERAVACCRRAGLRTTNSFILGAIEETRQTASETIDFALSLDSDFVLFNIYTAHPGTEGYKYATRAGIIAEYRVDTERYKGEPAGVPTVCKHLTRGELQYLKAAAYLKYYRKKGAAKYAPMIAVYEQELTKLRQVE